MRRRWTFALLAVALGAVAGCGRPSAAPVAVGPPCLDVPSAAGPAQGGLPAVTLACFAGGSPVRVAGLRGPLVINFWASSCEPCRTELPMLQAYAERAAGQVRVVGIVSRDTRLGAQSIIDDDRLTFPMLEDRDLTLLTGIGGRRVLPVTVFVDAAGRLAYVHDTGRLDGTALRRLTVEHLGVTVAA